MKFLLASLPLLLLLGCSPDTTQLGEVRFCAVIPNQDDYKEFSSARSPVIHLSGGVLSTSGTSYDFRVSSIEVSDKIQGGCSLPGALSTAGGDLLLSEIKDVNVAIEGKSSLVSYDIEFRTAADGKEVAYIYFGKPRTENLVKKALKMAMFAFRGVSSKPQTDHNNKKINDGTLVRKEFRAPAIDEKTKKSRAVAI